MLVPSCSLVLSVPIHSLLLNTFHPASDTSGIGSIGEIPAENNGEARRIEKPSCRGAKTCASIETHDPTRVVRHSESNRPTRQRETRQAIGSRAREPTRDRSDVQNGTPTLKRSQRATRGRRSASRRSRTPPVDRSAPRLRASTFRVAAVRASSACDGRRRVVIMYGRSDALSWSNFGFRDVLTTDRGRCYQSPMRGSARTRRGITRTAFAARQDTHRKASA